MWPFWGKKYLIYCSKIDLTPIFFFKQRFRKNIVSTGSYGKNSVLFTQSVNTSLSYIPFLFRDAILSRPDHATIFLRCCHVFDKKAKVIELPFCAKESCLHLGKHYFLGNFSLPPSRVRLLILFLVVFVPITFFPLFVSLGIVNVVLAYS